LPSTRSQRTTGGAGVNNPNIDISTSWIPQRREIRPVSPLILAQVKQLPRESRPSSALLHWTRRYIDRVCSLEGSDITDEKKPDDDVVSPSSSSTAPKVEFDLEAQQPPALTIAEQRRKSILEENPELTKEISF
jgi:hypothetical protein